MSTNKNVAVVVVLLPLVQKWTSGYPTNVDISNLLCQLILWSYTCDRVITSSKNSPSTLWYHMSAELFTCSWFFNKILQNQLPTHRAAFNTSTLCDHFVAGNIVYTSTTDSYHDLLWLYVYFLWLYCDVLMLFSAGDFKTTLYANTTSRIFFLMLAISSDLSQKKTYSTLNHFRFLVSPFHCN